MTLQRLRFIIRYISSTTLVHTRSISTPSKYTFLRCSNYHFLGDSSIGLSSSIQQREQQIPSSTHKCYYSIIPPTSTSSTDNGDGDDNGNNDNESNNILKKTYKEMIKKNDIEEDEHQLEAIGELDRLYYEIQIYESSKEEDTLNDNKINEASLFIWSFFDSEDKNNTTTADKTPSSSSSTSPPKGVYLHGGVGCGKTFCMNMFYDKLGETTQDRQQVHFHKFMLGVHQQMHEAKMVDGIDGDLVLPRVVERTLENGRIICFDEFQVTDVVDALILQQLFTSLLEKGAILIMTSNRPPEDLYLSGLQRDRFLPFIDFIRERMVVRSMWDSTTDYRLVQGNNKAKGVYFVGKKKGKEDFDAVFESLTDGTKVESTNLTTTGRLVLIPKASMSKGVARFTFQDLCTKALGAADYLVIGHTFHTVFVENIPTLSRDEINWVRRFILFVDSMYESHVKLIVHAQTQPESIFVVDLEDESCDEVFAFDRTRSRLEEMRSQQYLQKRWKAGEITTTKEK